MTENTLICAFCGNNFSYDPSGQTAYEAFCNDYNEHLPPAHIDKCENQKEYEEARKVFNLLDWELDNLQFKWAVFTKLFRRERARVQPLMRPTAALWGVLEESLFREMILGSCRLLDPIASSGKENLSIQNLWNKYGKKRKANDERVEQIEAAMQEIKNREDTLKTLRHKVLAHLGKLFYLDENRQQFEIKDEDIEVELNAVRTILNLLDGVYFHNLPAMRDTSSQAEREVERLISRLTAADAAETT